MDLIARLRRWVVGRPRVLLVDAPGQRVLAWEVEAEVDRRGWELALSPADTDLLVVLGSPGPELARAVDLLEAQIPQPSVRIAVDDSHEVVAALDAALSSLADAAERAEPEGERPSVPEPPAAEEQHEHDHEGHEDHDQGHEDHDEGDTEEGQEGHEHHHMHSGEVAGLAMADTGPDRDGLELDVLSISLGPVLVGWPTGLAVRAALQGDVLTGIEPRWVDDAEGADTPVPARGQRLLALDRLAQFLLVAGWPTAAREARRARAAITSGNPDGPRRAARVARRVSGSRVLAWSVSGMGPAAPEPERGEDVLGRVRRWCAAAAGEAGGIEAGPTTPGALPDLLEGVELAAARLVVASLELDAARVGSAAEEPHA